MASNQEVKKVFNLELNPEAYVRTRDEDHVYYDIFLDIKRMLGIVEKPTVANLVYPESNQQMVNDCYKAEGEDAVIYDLEWSIWRHRNVISMMSKTEKGEELIRKVVKKYARRKVFMEVNTSNLFLDEDIQGGDAA